MAKYRVKAYFMHEHEEAAARQATQAQTIADAEWTPGYVMGVVDEKEIQSLANKGLVVTAIEKVVSTAAAKADKAADPSKPINAVLLEAMVEPGVFSLNSMIAGNGRLARRVPVTSVGRTAKDKVESRNTKEPDFYVVRFHGPLTEDRREELKRLRIELLQRVTRNKYTVRLKPEEVKVLAEQKFVDTLRIYSVKDTVAAATTVAAVKPTRASKKNPRTAIYTVEVHRKNDLRVVQDWLAARKYKILWKGQSVLRVSLPERSEDLAALAKLPEVARLEEEVPPRLFGDFVRPLLRLDETGKPPFPFEGDGEVIGIADTGLDATHPDFQGRIAGVSAWGRKNDASDPEGHGTHVAGCALGDGRASNGKVRGAAPKATMFFQSILDANGNLGGLPEDLSKLFKEAYNNGARVHNNSWGAFAFARYSTTSLQVDRFVHANPDMLIVIAAGNDGMAIPRVANGAKNSDKGYVDWPSVAAPATAKNGLTVGASRSSRTQGGYASLRWSDAWADRFPEAPISKETISGDADSLAAFSSRGPCDDQSIKPDVVAPGTDIAATRSKDAPLRKFWGAYPQNGQYAFMGGTSMAAPYAAGCAALVREWYRKEGNCNAPSAALLKATLINGTQRLKGKDAEAKLEGDPNYHQGFGRLNMRETIPNPGAPRLKLAFDDTWQNPQRLFQTTGQRFRYRVRVAAGTALHICLAWTDPPARSLQNGLVLLVDDSSTKKWVGNAEAATLLRIAGAVADPNNNVQIVRIPAPVAGDYTIAVTASNLLVPSQAFALVVTGDLPSGLNFLA